jgi:hypothetical protein
MRPSLFVVVIATLILALPVLSSADEFYYEISGPTPVSGPCNYVEVPPFQINWTYTMQGYFVFDLPTSGVQFRLPPESWMDFACPGAVVVDGVPPYPDWTGDFETGVEINFGECVTGTTFVFQRSITISVNCVLGGILTPEFYPDPSPPYPAALLCDGGIRRVVDTSGCTAPPTNLMPADGAIGVSINPTMSCDWMEPQHCPEGIGLVIYTVYYGTDPASLDRTAWRDQTGEVPIGPLQYGTTYYWRMGIYDDYWNCPGFEYSWSPVMSFTTIDPVAAEKKSWGSLKAGYQKKD